MYSRPPSQSSSQFIPKKSHSQAESAKKERKFEEKNPKKGKAELVVFRQVHSACLIFGAKYVFVN